MERRKTILAAAAVAGTFLVGAVALTANADLVNAPTTDNVGQISPVSSPPTTIYLPAASGTTSRNSVESVPRPSGDHEADASYEGSERDD